MQNTWPYLWCLAPQAVLDIARGAMEAGTRVLALGISSGEFVRVTGRLRGAFSSSPGFDTAFVSLSLFASAAPCCFPATRPSVQGTLCAAQTWSACARRNRCGTTQIPSAPASSAITLLTCMRVPRSREVGSMSFTQRLLAVFRYEVALPQRLIQRSNWWAIGSALFWLICMCTVRDSYFASRLRPTHISSSQHYVFEGECDSHTGPQRELLSADLTAMANTRKS